MECLALNRDDTDKRQSHTKHQQRQQREQIETASRQQREGVNICDRPALFVWGEKYGIGQRRYRIQTQPHKTQTDTTECTDRDSAGTDCNDGMSICGKPVVLVVGSEMSGITHR